MALFNARFAEAFEIGTSFSGNVTTFGNKLIPSFETWKETLVGDGDFVISISIESDSLGFKGCVSLRLLEPAFTVGSFGVLVKVVLLASTALVCFSVNTFLG